MRVLTLRQPNLMLYLFSILLLFILLLPKPASSEGTNNTADPSKSSSSHEPSAVKPPEKVETPPTEYLPYPPPPNYSWPAGMTPQNENPQPSDHNPPAGWNTGQTGSSGSGSSSSSSSGAPPTSAASSSLRPLHLFHIIATLLPHFTHGARIPRILSQTPLNAPSASLPCASAPHAPAPAPLIDPASIPPGNLLSRLLLAPLALLPRTPVETPPTEFLPYPPPPNYSWPAGMSPQNENPQPSEHDPPAGWYTGQSGTSGFDSSSGSVGGAASGSKTPTTTSEYANGGLPSGYGQSPKPLKWWVIMLICVAGVAFLALVTWALWRLRKKMATKGVGPQAPEMGEGGGGGLGGNHHHDAASAMSGD